MIKSNRQSLCAWGLETSERLQRAPLTLPSYEDTVRRQLSMNQEMGLHQTPNLLVL